MSPPTKRVHSNAPPICFVVDAGQQRHKARILDWIRAHADQWPALAESQQPALLFLPVYSLRQTLPAQSLAALESAPPDTTLQPLQASSAAELAGRRSATAYLRGKISESIYRKRPAHNSDGWLASDRQVILGEAATAGELRAAFESQLESGGKYTTFAAFVASRARFALDIAERKLRGRRYKVPRQVAENIKQRATFRQAVGALAATSAEPESALWTRVDSILDELVAKPSPAWLDVIASFTKKMLAMGYENEMVVGTRAIETMRSCVEQFPTAFLWTHKSYLDGMVVPHVLYEHDLPPAHTFGGLNMAFAGMASSARHTGVIFIRRSFKDDELYKLVLQHYIAYLLENRFPFSWAFEGTRSRTGKLMPPKYGLLKYLLDACHATGTKNLRLLPIAINYDMLGEVSDHAREQAGMEKSAESMSWFLRYMRKLRAPMGRIFMDVGEPIVVRETIDPEDFDSVAKLAFRVGVEANRISPITLPSLVALVLLSAAPRALSDTELTATSARLVKWARDRGIPVSSDFDLESSAHANRILGIMLKNGLVTQYEAQPVRLFSISAEQHLEAAYYRNTIAHHFLAKAFTEIGLLRASNAESECENVFWQAIDNLRDLFKFEFFYEPREEFIQEVTRELEACAANWQSQLAQAAGARALLENHGPLVAPGVLRQFAEAYWVAGSVLCQAKTGDTIEKKDFTARCLGFGQQAFLQQEISSRASVAKPLFGSAYDLAENYRLLESGNGNAEGKRQAFRQRLRELLDDMDALKARHLAALQGLSASQESAGQPGENSAGQ